MGHGLNWYLQAVFMAGKRYNNEKEISYYE
jgi:hypothetical protein